MTRARYGYWAVRIREKRNLARDSKPPARFLGMSELLVDRRGRKRIWYVIRFYQSDAGGGVDTAHDECVVTRRLRGQDS